MSTGIAIKPYAIFDMDGTLVDSMWCWNGVYIEFLTAHGAGAYAKELVENTAYLTTYESAVLFRDRLSLDISASDIAVALDGRMKELYQTEVCEKPGVRAWLEQLRNHGVRMCIVSSTPEPLIRVCLERLGLIDFFSFILSCDTIGIGKDAPDAYLAAAKRMGAKPSETAVYEDSPVALLTAKEAGFYAVAVYDDSSANQWAEMCRNADAAVLDWRKVTKG
jgi:HAD superfamily phosphoserine phosphatase-like hydrolase